MILKDYNKIALIDGQSTVSYRELMGHVREFASVLSIEHGDRVALYAENRLEWIYACYGIWNHGGIAVPLDFLMADDTLARVLNDCKPSVIFTSEKGAQNLSRISGLLEHDPEIIVFEEMAISSGYLPELLRELDEEDTALIVYTSGTTGAPKGVMLSYRNLMATIQGLIDFDIMRKEDVVMGLLPFHHIYPMQGTIFLPLYVGATVVYVHTLSAPAILTAMKEHKVTFFIGVPRIYELFHKATFSRINKNPALRLLVFLARKADSVRLSRKLFAKIHANFGGHTRLYASGGSKLDSGLARDMRALGFVLDEGYGLTETAPIIAFNPFDRIKLGAAGLPLPGTEIKIVDDEIATKGPHVMKGYYNNPEETARRIVDGWFYTGDTGYIDSDGYVYVTGRKDDMIVLPSGKNINPEEIENHILSLSPLVEEVGVLLRGGRLTALVRPNYELLRKMNISNIMETIKGKVIGLYNSSVPVYKKIADVSVVRSPLPKTNLGKLQRFLLNTVKIHGEDRPREVPDPDYPEYALLKTLLEEMTGRHIHPDDHLDLDIGLDSLGKVELAVSVENTFGLALSDNELSGYTTVEALAGFIRDRKTRMENSPASWKEILSADIDLPLPKASSGMRLLRSVIAFFVRVMYRTRVEGLEKLPERPFIMAPNHQSYLDAPLIVAKLPEQVMANTCFVAKEKPLYRSRLGSRLIQGSQLIVVDIDRNLKSSLQKIAAVTRSGKNMVIFPEGTRTRDGQIASFKKLFAILSRELDVPVVPLAIRGSYEAMPPGAVLPRPGSIDIIVCDPVYPQGKDYDQICSEARSAITGKISPSD